jgi:hypothetical protein
VFFELNLLKDESPMNPLRKKKKKKKKKKKVGFSDHDNQKDPPRDLKIAQFSPSIQLTEENGKNTETVLGVVESKQTRSCRGCCGC